MTTTMTELSFIIVVLLAAAALVIGAGLVTAYHEWITRREQDQDEP